MFVMWKIRNDFAKVKYDLHWKLIGFAHVDVHANAHVAQFFFALSNDSKVSQRFNRLHG